jgi:hypothetical protein
MEDNKKLYSIIRIKKLNKKTLLSADKHNKRQIDVPNANGKKHIRLLNFNDKKITDETLFETVKSKMSEFNVSAKRKDAILAIEVLLTATPEFFTVDKSMPFSLKNVDRDALNNWYEKTVQWLKQKFKKTLLQAQLHLDESTPHIHAFFLPVIEKVVGRKLSGLNPERAIEPASLLENKLCAKDVVTRSWLYTLHDEYSRVMKTLGLERAKRHSQAKHQTLKTYGITTKKIDSKKLELRALENEEIPLQKNKEHLTFQAQELEKNNSLIRQKITEIKEQLETTKSKEININKAMQKIESELAEKQGRIYALHRQKMVAVQETKMIKQQLQNMKSEVAGMEEKFGRHFTFFKQAELLAKKFTEEVVDVERLLVNLPLPSTLQNRFSASLDKMKKLFDNYLVGSAGKNSEGVSNNEDIREVRRVSGNSPSRHHIQRN